MSEVLSTTENNYLTSITALNVPCDDGTGDWHFFESFTVEDDWVPTHKIAGVNTLSTNEWLGNTGIFDCTDILLAYGASPIFTKNKVYSADHYRAVVDMVHNSVKNGYSINDSISLNDWLPEPAEKQRVYQLLDRLKPAFTANQWMIIEEWKTLTAPPD